MAVNAVLLTLTVGVFVAVISRGFSQEVPPLVLRTFSSPQNGFSVSCKSDGSYSLHVDGSTWLNSAPTFFNIQGRMYSTEDGSLAMRGVSQDAGEDSLGPWESVEYTYGAGQTRVMTAVRVYAKIPAIVFDQQYIDGALNTSVNNKDLLVSGFPGFKVDDSEVDLGYLAYGYLMVGNMGRKLGRWSPKTFTIKDGRNGGPLLLFDKKGTTLLMTPFNQFMAASPSYNKHTGRYYWGIMGGVKEVPQSFSYKTIIYYGQGINTAFEGWGKTMRFYYNKLPHYREADFTNNYLSYWSDNGAYYVNYYVKGGLIQNMTYEEAMLAVNQYSTKLQIPYRSVQYSVWFKLGKVPGNYLWVANPKLFPSGMKYMFEKTMWPATAHSRYWSPDTPYAKQNGGQYNFVLEEKYGLPLDEQFWTDMFSQSQQWGFKTYMQDWLNWQFDSMNTTTDNVHNARTWLMQMGEGASKNGITIQYCMSESRHILQSLEIQSVTQARVSDDYQPNDPKQWRIGMSSMFAHAVGLAPFKDTFWTTTTQPDNFYHGKEPYPAMHVVIATLSTGAVGPGDMVNGTDANLLMRCCAADGLILKPSRPALSVDAQIIQNAFGGEIGPDGEVWTTYSDIGRHRFGIIFAAALHNWFEIGPTAAGFGLEFPESRVYSVYEPTAVHEDAFTDTTPVLLTADCSQSKFCLYYTTPVFHFSGQELLLLGEVSKWVPISPQRVTSISWDVEDFVITLKGAAMERVEFLYQLGGKVAAFHCTMSQAGTAKISLQQRGCFSV